MSALVWFRRDLRLDDNPAWVAATKAHETVTALFVIDPALWDRAPKRRTNLLAAHLAALDQRLGALGGRLRVVSGPVVSTVVDAAAGHDAVCWNDDYSPYAVERDTAVADVLSGSVSRHAGVAFHPPGSITTGDGGPYRVFTPYWRRWRDEPWDPPGESGEAVIAADPGEGVPDHPPVRVAGEVGAAERLAAFMGRIDRYGEDRNRPDVAGTSGLSADLKFGTIGPRRIRAEIGDSTEGRVAFTRQLCWRDFYLQILANRPDTVNQPFRAEYAGMRWHRDDEGFAAWKEGQTGYPIVDAAMRQLASEGWIHNRGRMIAASFLVKDLLIDWRLGERWFRRRLVDADVAQNVGNWQWVAGTGVDAAPYFRVFNPVTQAMRFDPDGDYVRTWVPELRGLPAPGVHAPWEADPSELEAAGIVLGKTYPARIVDHAVARERAIAAYERARAER